MWKYYENVSLLNKEFVKKNVISFPHGEHKKVTRKCLKCLQMSRLQTYKNVHTIKKKWKNYSFC